MAANPAAMGTPGIGKKPGVFAWLLLLPLLVWLAIFVIGPNIIMSAYSVGKPDALGQVQFSKIDETGKTVSVVSADNYARIVSLPEILAISASLSLGFLIGLACWMLINKTDLHYDYGQSAFIISFTVGACFMWLMLNAYVLDAQIRIASIKSLYPSHFEFSVWNMTFQWLFPFTKVQLDVSWLKIFVVSINYAAISTTVCVLAGYPVAYFIGKAPEKWRNALLMLVMVPFWTSFLVRTYAWVTILRSEGILNQFLMSWHIIDQPLDLYPSQIGVMIGLIYTYLPFMILPIYTSIERLDNAFVEAAFDLGASPLRAFNNVIFPLTRPGVIAGILLVFVPAVGMFAVNDILGGRQEMLIGNVIEQQFTKAKNPPFGAALGVLLLVLFIVIYYFMTRRRDAVQE